MKHLVLIAALVASPTIAADPDPAVTTMTVTGETGWSMICHVSPKGDDEFVRFLETGRNTMTAKNVRKLACEYKGSSHGPITITINPTTLPCPFKGAPVGECATTLRKSGVGSFDVQAKG